MISINSSLPLCASIFSSGGLFFDERFFAMRLRLRS
jgi:hypothetical protein